jgi:hypothetical protein
MPKPSYIDFGKRAVLAGGFVNDTYKFNGIKVYNETGSAIAADKLVAVGVTYDVTTGLPNVVLADADTVTHKDIYVTLSAIADAAVGYVFKGGKSAANLDTSGATTVGDPIYLSQTAGGFVHSKPGGSGVTVLPVGWSTVKSATVGQIHWHIGEAERIDGESEVVSAANVITAAENGKVFFLNSATEFASTLPAPFAGAHFTFIVTAAPSQASYTVVTEGGCQILAGSVHPSVLNDSSDFEAAATGTTITFVDGQAVVGDMAELWSDGTSWFAKCFCTTGAGITITG